MSGYGRKDNTNHFISDRAIFLAHLLRRRGIPLGVPWLDALAGLSVRVYNLLKNAGLETLGDVLRAMRNEGGERPLGKNPPRHVFDELWEAFEVLAGPAVTSCHPPLAESAEAIFENDPSEPEWGRQPLSEYTLARLGREQGVSGNAIQLRIHRILRLTRARSRTAALELVGPLLKAMEASGGLVHRDVARDLTGTDDLRQICLAALFANADLRIWREEFLTTLAPTELAQRSIASRQPARPVR